MRLHAVYDTILYNFFLSFQLLAEVNVTAEADDSTNHNGGSTWPKKPTLPGYGLNISRHKNPVRDVFVELIGTM